MEMFFTKWLGGWIFSSKTNGQTIALIYSETSTRLASAAFKSEHHLLLQILDYVNDQY